MEPNQPQAGQIPGTNTQPTGQPEQIDPTALTLSRAIRKVENTGYDQTIAEPNGTSSFGAYGWNGDNFHEWAKQYGLNPEDTSQTNQDHLAYLRIKDMLDQGIPQSQVAARWNGSKLVNGQYQPINPDYVKNVQKAYEELSGGQQELTSGVPALQISKQTPVAQGQTSDLGQELIKRGQDVGTAVSQTLVGKINPLSGLIQTVGAGAGALGDVVGKGLELIPGVKQVENLIGQGIGTLAQTPMGQSVAKSIQDFSKEHPELADDIGAGFNIITAIPIFKGLGVLKNVALDSASVALKNAAEKGAVNDLTEVLSRTGAGREALQNVPDGLDSLVKNNALPSLTTEGGITRYDTHEAFKKMSEEIAKVDEKELQPILEKASEKISDQIPLEDFRQMAIQTAQDELKDTAGVNTMFDRIKTKYGDYPTLKQMNDAKRTISKQISEATFGDPNVTTNIAVRRALQKGVEQGVSRLGLGDVSAVNQKMASLIKAQDMLHAIEGKTVKNAGLMHQAIGAGSAAIGAGIGGAFGGPISPMVGGLVGYGAKGYVEGKLAGLTGRTLRGGILKRAAPGAIRQTAPKVAKKTGGLVAGTLAQKQNR